MFQILPCPRSTCSARRSPCFCCLLFTNNARRPQFALLDQLSFSTGLRRLYIDNLKRLPTEDFVCCHKSRSGAVACFFHSVLDFVSCQKPFMRELGESGSRNWRMSFRCQGELREGVLFFLFWALQLGAGDKPAFRILSGRS